MKLRSKFFDVVPTRLGIGLMMFFVTFFNYMLRVNMSVNIIAMVPAKLNSTTVKGECAALALVTNDSEWSSLDESSLLRRPAKHQVVLEWTEQQQAYVLSSYFWSYAVSGLLGGLAVDRWGATRLIFITMLIAAVFTIFSPQASKLHYLALVAIRLIIGFASGVHFPALHALVARWAPPDEKGLFVSSLVGGAIGTVVTWSLTGPLIEALGWEYAFYVPGLIVLAWTFLWWYLVYDSPVLHSRITETERKYILNAIGERVLHKQTKVLAPFKKVLTSGPYIAFVFLQFGTLWGVYFVMTAAPKYLSSALGFNLTSTGGLSSLPYLARMLASLLFGYIGDTIVKRKWMSITFMRKFFTIFSHVIPGILLASLGYAGCSPALSITIMTCALGFNGAAVLTNLVNAQDLAPNFAASIYGVCNGICNLAGFITPLVTAYFTKNGNGFAEWRPVFLIGAVFYVAAAFYFMVFGSGETQEWNYIQSDEENNKEIQTKD